jgi:hypothetical protein
MATQEFETTSPASTLDFVQQLCELNYDDLPEPTVPMTKWLLTDLIGVSTARENPLNASTSSI